VPESSALGSSNVPSLSAGAAIMEEIDIWRTASVLMTRRGDAARFAAARCADDLLKKNDYQSVAVWMRIGRARDPIRRACFCGSCRRWWCEVPV